MGHPGGMAGSSWGMMRSMRRKDELGDKRVGKATALRVLRFARPYRRSIAVFLLLVVASSGIAVVTPLLAGDVINAIYHGGPEAGRVVIMIALLIAALAVVDAVLAIAQRYQSARIGEGIIYDLRTQMYDHVQRLPLQFFTRTQTGALVSRLNNDVIGAQQAFTSTLSGTVGNVIALVLTAGVMVSLSWQVTLLLLVLVPAFLLPARLVGQKMAAITRE